MTKLLNSVFFFAFVFFASCSNQGARKQRVQALDSLSGALSHARSDLQNADTVTLQKAVQRFNHYRQFIEQNLNDTITKTEADVLQLFFNAGNTLQQYRVNRNLLLSHAEKIQQQIKDLRSDAAGNAMDAELLDKYFFSEREDGRALINHVSEQQKLFHTSLQEFKGSLNAVEEIMRRRNHGELPTIVEEKEPF
jgi:hypothetical protein